jgi:hypothetical protein
MWRPWPKRIWPPSFLSRDVSSDPVRTNRGLSSRSSELKIKQVPLAVLVLSSQVCDAPGGGVSQGVAQLVKVIAGEAKNGREDACYVASIFVIGAQAIVADFAKGR